MSNGYTVLNPGSNGDVMDEESTSYTSAPVLRKKPRVVIAGNAPDGADIVLPKNASPDSSDYALPTRSLPATPKTPAMAGAPINASAAGDNTIVPGVGGQTTRVFKLFLVAESAVQIKFKNGAGVDLTPYMKLTAGGSMTLDFDGEPWFVTGAATDFIINLSDAVQVSGRLSYQQS